MKKLIVLCLTLLMLFSFGAVAGAKSLKLGLDAGPVSQDPQVQLSGEDPLFEGFPEQAQVWMSHGDQVQKVSDDFISLASTETCPIAAVKHHNLPVYGLQFHPEVTHTLQGERILGHFVLEICGCEALWTPARIVEDAIERVRYQVGDDKVLLGLSGGVDSSVVAALLHRAIGSRNHGRLFDLGYGLQHGGLSAGALGR